MSAFTNLFADIAQYAGRGIEQGIQEQIATEGGIRRQARLFHAGKPLRGLAREEERASGLQTAREEYGLKRELEAPKRQEYGRILGPILEQGGIFPEMASGEMPTAERAEMEIPPFYKELDPDLAKTMLNYLAAKERSEEASFFKMLPYLMPKPKPEGEPAPTLERKLDEEFNRLVVGGKEKPERKFDWQQEQREKAAGGRAAATTLAGLRVNPAELRKEFRQVSKRFVDVRDAMGRIREIAKKPSPASDVALIYNIVKLWDPDTGVKEGEIATAQSAGAIPDRMLNIYNSVVKGMRLTPQQREDFIRQAKDLYGSHLQSHRATERHYQGIAERTGLVPQDVIERLELPEESAAVAPGKPGRRYASPTAVRDALRVGELTSDQAAAILRQDFGFGD